MTITDSDGFKVGYGKFAISKCLDLFVFNWSGQNETIRTSLLVNIYFNWSFLKCLGFLFVYCLVQPKVFAVSGRKSNTKCVYFPKIKFIVYYKIFTIKSSYLIFCIAISIDISRPTTRHIYVDACARSHYSLALLFIFFKISQNGILLNIKKKISRCNLWPSIRRRQHNYRKGIALSTVCRRPTRRPHRHDPSQTVTEPDNVRPLPSHYLHLNNHKPYKTYK